VFDLYFQNCSMNHIDARMFEFAFPEYDQLWIYGKFVNYHKIFGVLQCLDVVGLLI